jgi:hypothetical protein
MPRSFAHDRTSASRNSYAEDMVRQILLEKTAPAFDLTMFSHELSAVLTELQQVLAAERAKVLELPPLRSVRRVN